MRRSRRPSTILASALRASLPVFLGYLTIGLAFGLLLVKADLPWWMAPLMSVVVYAGAAQFMALGLLSAGTGYLEIAVLTLVLNARHMVYGLSLLERFKIARRFKPYLVYALTDETYGLLTTMEAPEGSTEAQREEFYLAVSALDQSYWVGGTTLGALLGGLINFDTRGLDFALTSLFVVLLVEQIKTVRQPAPYIVAGLATVLAYLVVGPSNLLLVAILLSIGGILLLRKRLP